MKIVSFFVSIVSVLSAEEVCDESGVSLLQHSVRTIRKAEEAMNAPPGDPPPGVVARIAARRERRRAERAAGRGPSDLSPAQLERRRARRRAKRQAQRAGHIAASRHFADGGDCDTCAAQCNAIFNDEFKDCMIREDCQPWQKEDGPAANKCAKRCDRAGNWKREPCIRKCECDVDLIGSSSKVTTKKKFDEEVDWADGHHRCRNIEIGSISTCTSLTEASDSPAYDSIKKCAKAAEQAGADTFNFFRTAKEYGKCSLRQCGGPDLQIARAPAEPEAPAGRGNWKVFSTHCPAPPEDQRNDNGGDESSR